MATTLHLVVLLSLLGCCCGSFPSIYLAFLILLLPTSLPFVLTKIKQLRQGLKIVPKDAIGQESKTPEDQSTELKFIEPVDCESVARLETDSPLLDEVDSLHLSAAHELSDANEVACWSSESLEGSISDDDSLIEIALLDGHYIAPEVVQRDLEAVFRQHGLMELLAEISEEENLIEIDIDMGSIKCSRLEIQA